MTDSRYNRRRGEAAIDYRSVEAIRTCRTRGLGSMVEGTMNDKNVQRRSRRWWIFASLLIVAVLVNVGVSIAWYAEARAWKELEQRWIARPRPADTAYPNSSDKRPRDRATLAG